MLPAAFSFPDKNGTYPAAIGRKETDLPAIMQNADTVIIQNSVAEFRPDIFQSLQLHCLPQRSKQKS